MTVGKSHEVSTHRGFYGWFEERLKINEIWHALFLRKIPFGVNLLYTLGFAAIGMFLVQAITGSILALYYSPSPDHAYDSVQYITTEVPFGEVVRGIHHWGASAMVALVVLHMLAVFIMGAYKYPREATWVVGVLLFAVTLGFGFTGYLLPWDEKAYWATTVGTNIAGTAPEIGGYLVRFLRGGAELGTLTLTRFYASHAMLLPMIILGLIGLHVFMVIRQGVSVPPGMWDREGKDPARRSGLEAAVTGTREEVYHKRYEGFKAKGRPFFPDLIFEDTVVAVVVILIVVAMGVLAGTGLEAKADPTNSAYVPRPEWYFMFLFEMLKYFPGALEWFGALLLPGLFVILLVALPFFDRRGVRAPLSRPFAMVCCALVVFATTALTVRAFQATPPSGSVAEERALRLSAVELQGRQLTGAQGCTGCHVVSGEGGASGPSLDGIGSRRDAAFIHSYIEHPKSLNPSATMPPFIPPLSHEQVEEITRYLLTLK